MVTFSTLGMFIIDEFQFPSDKAQIPDQVGGGGTYATIGARMHLPPEKVKMIVDRGSDFPPAIGEQLDSYGKDCWIYRDDASRLTTKARATYNGETRGFQYLSPRKKISPRDLHQAGLPPPGYLHFVVAPTRALEIIEELDRLGWSDSVKLIYEPIPFMCIPSEMESLRKVLPRLEVFSPNHEEAGTFFNLRLEEEIEGDYTNVYDNTDGHNFEAVKAEDKRSKIEELAQRFLDEGAAKHVVIRSGKMGCFVKTRDGFGTPSTSAGTWLPAYYQPDTVEGKVVDVTGAGNAFLGGLIAGLSLEDGNIEQACLYGSVSSSYTIEQYGLPSLTDAKAGIWNAADRPSERLAALRRRVGI